MAKKSVRAPSARSSRAQQRPKSRPAKRQQPLHIRLSLHPASLMTALCAGVFLVFSTISSFGDSYTVTASIPATTPTVPAVIIDPAEGTHFTNQSLTISGSCPTNSYVTVAVNGTVAGTSWCNAGTFSIAALLQPGADQLIPQDYNVTDQPGPISAPVNVVYDQPATPPPPVVVPPVALVVTQVDSNVPYVSQSTVEQTDDLPNFTGIAPPFARVTLLVHSDVVICNTTADANGFWRCTLPTALPVGIHTVNVSAVTTSGQNLSLPQFKIQVTAKPVAVPAPAPAPLTLISPYQYRAYLLNQEVSFSTILNGGNAPYAVSVNWGDGQSQTLSSASGALTLTHRYTKTSSSFESFDIKVQAVDSKGRTTSLQLVTLIRNPNYHAAATTSGSGTGVSGIQNLLASVHSWLWLLWPAYLIVVLMLISFWLGERKQYGDDRKRWRLVPTAARKHRTHRRRHA